MVYKNLLASWSRKTSILVTMFFFIRVVSSLYRGFLSGFADKPFCYAQLRVWPDVGKQAFRARGPLL